VLGSSTTLSDLSPSGLSLDVSDDAFDESLNSMPRSSDIVFLVSVDLFNFVLKGMSSFFELVFSSLHNSLAILDVVHDIRDGSLSVVEMKFAPSVGFGGLDVILDVLQVIPDIVMLLLVDEFLFWESVLEALNKLFADVFNFMFVLLGLLDEVLNLTSNSVHVSIDSLLSSLVNLIHRSNSVFLLSFFGKASILKAVIVTFESLEVVFKLNLSLLFLGFGELNLCFKISHDLLISSDVMVDGGGPVVDDLLLVGNCNLVVIKTRVFDGLVPCMLDLGVSLLSIGNPSLDIILKLLLVSCLEGQVLHVEIFHLLGGSLDLTNKSSNLIFNLWSL
jgi:hypothetical protein